MLRIETLEKIREQPDEMLNIAYHGVMAAIADRRMERAGSVLEKMDRKDVLYADLAHMAIANTHLIHPDTVDGEPPKARTVVEKLAERKIEKRAVKANRAELRNFHAERLHGTDKSDHVPTIRKVVKDRAVNLVAGNDYHPVDAGILKTSYRNTGRALKGPEIKGSTPLKKRIDRTINMAKLLTGKKSYHEARLESIDIRARPPKYGNKVHKMRRKTHRRMSEKLEFSVERPISNKYRAYRRERAMDRIMVQHEHAEKHRELSDRSVE
jgi:hypothetical protein